MGVDGGEDGGGQVLLFKQTTELEQRGGIRRRFVRQVDADEAADGLAVVDRILSAFIGQPEKLLCDLHAQHPQYTDWPPAATFALGVGRFNHRNQIRPRRYRFDVSQK